MGGLTLATVGISDPGFWSSVRLGTPAGCGGSSVSHRTRARVGTGSRLWQASSRPLSGIGTTCSLLVTWKEAAVDMTELMTTNASMGTPSPAPAAASGPRASAIPRLPRGGPCPHDDWRCCPSLAHRGSCRSPLHPGMTLLAVRTQGPQVTETLATRQWLVIVKAHELYLAGMAAVHDDDGFEYCSMSEGKW